MASLIEICTVPGDIPEPILQEYGLSQSHFDTKPFKFEGFVSRPNNGRSASDRQFLFINSRPFDSPKILKIINEVYHSFSSRNQYPFVLINIITSQDNVDVNVSPDKRSIYLQNEKILYSTIKATLLELFTSMGSTFEQSSQLLFPKPAESQTSSVGIPQKSAQPDTLTFSPQFSGTPSGKPNVRSLFTRFRVGHRSNDSQLLMQSEESQSQPQSQVVPAPASVPKSNSQSNLRHGRDFTRFRTAKQPKLFDFIASQKSSKIRKVEPDSVDTIDLESDSNDTPENVPTSNGSNEDISQQSDTLTTCEYFCDNRSDGQEMDLDAELECNISITKSNADSQMTDEGIADSSPSSPPLSPIISYTQSSLLTKSSSEGFSRSQESEEVIIIYDDELDDKDIAPSQEGSLKCGPHMRLKLKLQQLKSKLSEQQKLKLKSTQVPINGTCKARKFRADLTDNKAAEQELKKEFKQQMFTQVNIIGQFNLGFIIARHGADLFIIDQHASDEKYNFETLEKSLVLQNQKLICPKSLELPVVSENVLIDNLDTFRKNGFDFEIDENEKPTNRIKLTSIPYSKAYEFGREDIEELIFMLEDAPEKCFCRPTKVRTMLASRACRKSVMIGTALGMKEMTEIVSHMTDLDQPWNCPHGRPTLRHLFNLNLMTDADTETLQFNH